LSLLFIFFCNFFQQFTFMKTSIVAALLFSIGGVLLGQTVNPAINAPQSSLPSSKGAPYIVVEKSANSRVWARTNFEQSASGE